MGFVFAMKSFVSPIFRQPCLCCFPSQKMGWIFLGRKYVGMRGAFQRRWSSQESSWWSISTASQGKVLKLGNHWLFIKIPNMGASMGICWKWSQVSWATALNIISSCPESIPMVVLPSGFFVYPPFCRSSDTSRAPFWCLLAWTRMVKSYGKYREK